MKIIRDKTGTFPRRLWFEDGEIEGIAGKHREGCIALAGEADRLALPVDKFTEIYLPAALKKEIVLDPYADLAKTEGPGVLGATYFYDDHLAVKVDRRVTEEAEGINQWGRYNATVIHEAGHCLLHPVIFQEDPNQQVLFHSTPTKKISCLKRTIEGCYTGEWWEFQANKMMANLLMPREPFLAHFEMERNAYGIKDNGELAKSEGILKSVVGYLASTFRVSKQAARIRLHELRQISDPRQGEFLQTDGFVSVSEIQPAERKLLFLFRVFAN